MGVWKSFQAPIFHMITKQEIFQQLITQFNDFQDMPHIRRFLLSDITTINEKVNILEQAFHYGVTVALNELYNDRS